MFLVRDSDISYYCGVTVKCSYYYWLAVILYCLRTYALLALKIMFKKTKYFVECETVPFAITRNFLISYNYYINGTHFALFSSSVYQLYFHLEIRYVHSPV